jgi:hypothetical protein
MGLWVMGDVWRSEPSRRVPAGYAAPRRNAKDPREAGRLTEAVVARHSGGECPAPSLLRLRNRGTGGDLLECAGTMDSPGDFSDEQVRQRTQRALKLGWWLR